MHPSNYYQSSSPATPRMDRMNRPPANQSSPYPAFPSSPASNSPSSGAGGGSIFLHKGFWDILSATGSRFLNQDSYAQYPPPPPQPIPITRRGAPMSPGDVLGLGTGTVKIGNARSPAKYSGGGIERKGKKLNAAMIGRPMGFTHLVHASDAEQAADLLTRWQMEGVGKLGDPAWALPIKEAARARARAQGVAEVQAMRYADSQLKGQLQIVNGLPGTPSTTTGGDTLKSDIAVENFEPEPLMPPSWPTGENAPPEGRNTERLKELQRQLAGGATVTQLVQARIPSNFIPPTTQPPIQQQIQIPQSVTSPTLQSEFDQATVRPRALPIPPTGPQAQQRYPQQVAFPLTTAPPPTRAPLPFSPSPAQPAGTVVIKADDPMLQSLKTPSPPSSPKSVYDYGSPSLQGHKFVWNAEQLEEEKPKPFVPSLTTVEKSVATKVFLENHYYGILKRPRDRDQRKAMLEEELIRLGLPEREKENVRLAWALSETEHLRDMRKRVSNNSFATLKVIGHGAFGVVTLVREKPTGNLYAMKQLRKADMLRKGQEGHVRAERDLMTAASTTSRWIVRLVYSFQDVDHLYLVMEFMGGGDLLNLLIERDIFDEKFARFYVAEMVLAIQEAHKLGYIHRDIKPDNFLFDLKGHIKISDFGLATDFHWAHDGAYYDQQRRHLLHKHGIDLEDTQPPGGATRRYNNRDLDSATLPGEGQPGSVLTWRDKNRRKLAYSVVGTNNYMSVEVLRGTGYDQSCDWWSLGVIVYEMLYGFPPFISKSRHITRQKIMNWRQSFRFPPSPKISRRAQDLIERLICEREDRLGYKGATSASRPNSMIINQRRSGFINASGGPAPGVLDFGLRDGAEDIKAHPWFKGIDFSTIHLQIPPFVPELKDPTDTRYFEDDIDANPLPAPDANPNADPRDQTKDPMLKDRTHGQHLLEVRKQLAFQGFTFKRPKRSVYDPRNGVIDISELTKGNDKRESAKSSNNKSLAPDGSRLRSMSL